jgi:hypothetical protein
LGPHPQFYPAGGMSKTEHQGSEIFDVFGLHSPEKINFDSGRSLECQEAVTQ